MIEARISKIEKLLRKAERAGTPEEADAFFAGAQALMTKWAIDEAMLSMEGKSSDEIGTEHLTIKRSGYFKSMVQLVSVVARANNVKCLVYGGGWKNYAGVDLIGWKTDIEKVKMLYTSLLIQLSRERTRSTPYEVKTGPESIRNRWRHSFAMAYAIRIGERLREQAELTKREAVKADSSGSLLPALIDKHEAVERYYAEIPKGKLRADRSRYDSHGLNAGREAANRADLGNVRVGQTAKGELR